MSDKLQTREQMLASMAQQSNGWVAHDGGPCPVRGDALVEVQFRDGEVSTGKSAGFWDDDNPLYSNWRHRPDDNDITSYRAVKP